MSNDAYTELNAGAGGDVMDESSIAYGVVPLARKRPRVVLGGDAGTVVNSYGTTVSDLVQPVAADPGASPVSIPALALGVVSDVPQQFTPNELRAISLTTEGRVRVSSVPARVDFTTVDESSSNPWGRDWLGSLPSPWDNW